MNSRHMVFPVGLVLAILVPVGFASAASDSAAYTYDQNGRVQTVMYANGTTITYTYDTAGNRQQVLTACSAGGC